VYPYTDGLLVVCNVSDVDVDMQDGILMSVCVCSGIATNRIKFDLKGQYNFVNNMGSHSVRTH
jgi:hypothetical protein